MAPAAPQSQPSPSPGSVPLPLPGLGILGEQQHYGINHHRLLVLSSPSPLFKAVPRLTG